MNRKSFLLSLPLIGLAAKALSKSEEQKTFFNAKRLKERQDFLRKYPLTEKECYKKSYDGCVLVWSEEKQSWEKGILMWEMGTDKVRFVKLEL